MFEVKNLNVLNKLNKQIFYMPIDFIIRKNQIWRIISEKGVGKSSLYEAIIGIIPVLSGEIFFKKIKINNISSPNRIKMGIKYIAQQSFFFEDLSIKENLELYATYLVSSQEITTSVEKSIELFDLKNIINKYPHQLSKGQIRLSEISKMIIGANDFIILDDPFSAIDQYTIDNIIPILLTLKEEGKSLLINDRNIKTIDSIVNHDIIIYPNHTKISQHK